MAIRDAEMKALKPYEKNFTTAIRSGWASYPGGAALDMMHAIVSRETGSRARLNKSCGACVLGLLRDVGKLYFASKAQKNGKK